mgnify:CR=1 FL=1
MLSFYFKDNQLTPKMKEIDKNLPYQHFLFCEIRAQRERLRLFFSQLFLLKHYIRIMWQNKYLPWIHQQFFSEYPQYQVKNIFFINIFSSYIGIWLHQSWGEPIFFFIFYSLHLTFYLSHSQFFHGPEVIL